MPKVAFTFITVCLLMSIASCKRTPIAVSSSPSSAEPAKQSAQADPSAYDPVCCSPYTSDGLKKAWGNFTESGRFKVTREHSYEYIWGDMGYDFDGQFKHLAVLVTDTLKSGPKQYGVVIFSAPNGGNGSYKQYWLNAIEATGNTEIRRASGYLFVDGCSVRWSRSKTQYVCG